ncbi:MAG: hypothetical protein WA858_16780, partial [Xanthobacteraceae bacterium]
FPADSDQQKGSHVGSAAAFSEHTIQQAGQSRLGRVLINPCCKRSSLNVRFVPEVTELLRRREMTQRAIKRHDKTWSKGERDHGNREHAD